MHSSCAALLRLCCRPSMPRSGRLLQSSLLSAGIPGWPTTILSTLIMSPRHERPTPSYAPRKRRAARQRRSCRLLRGNGPRRRIQDAPTESLEPASRDGELWPFRAAIPCAGRHLIVDQAVMAGLRHRARNGSARLSRVIASCLLALALAFSVIASETAAAPSPVQSDGLLTLSSHPTADHAGPGDPADAGVVFHVHCGCHQVMRAEPVAFEPVRTADRVVYPVRTEPLTARSASPLRRPPRV
jgi:hypothetical protein